MFSPTKSARIKNLPPALAQAQERQTPVSQDEVDAVVALLKSGKVSAALSEAQRLAQRAPDLVPLLDIQGTCLKALGDLPGALGCFKRSLEVGGSTAIGHFNIGSTLLQLKLVDQATEHLSQAVVLDPANVEMGTKLAVSLNTQGQFMEAVHIVSALIKNSPVSDELLNVLGQALWRLGRLTEAKTCFGSISKSTKLGEEAQCQLGLIALAENEKEAARKHFSDALEVNPKLTTAHRCLSLVTTYETDHPHIGEMLQLLDEPGLRPTDESKLRFALYKALNDAKQYDTAFMHLKCGNDLENQALGYSTEKEEGIFAYLKQVFDRPTPAAQSEIAFRPIFIVGLPRSGTTVTERALCGCSNVAGVGELQYATTAMSKLMKQVLASEQGEFTQVQAQSLRDALSQAMQNHAEGAAVIIEKTPLNFRWIGGLLAAFPEARIIYTTRPARDQLWSLYQVNLLGDANGFCYSLDDIANYQALTQDLMQHWMQLFPDRIFHLDFTDLTREPEEHIRTLVDFCDLEWSDDCLHPEKQNKAIQTASALQARKAIYHRPTPDWLPYEAHLERAFCQLDKLGL